MYNFLGAHRHSRWFFVLIANSLNCLKALKKDIRALKNSESFEQIFFDVSWLYYL